MPEQVQRIVEPLRNERYQSPSPDVLPDSTPRCRRGDRQATFAPARGWKCVVLRSRIDARELDAHAIRVELAVDDRLCLREPEQRI